jgi:hypothetical protein
MEHQGASVLAIIKKTTTTIIIIICLVLLLGGSTQLTLTVHFTSLWSLVTIRLSPWPGDAVRFVFVIISVRSGAGG